MTGASTASRRRAPCRDGGRADRRHRIVERAVTPGTAIAARASRHLRLASALLVAAMLLAASAARADSYRCDVGGRVTYSDRPCAAGSQTTVETDDPVSATDRGAAAARAREDAATLARYERDRQRERQQDLRAAALARKRRSDVVKDAQGCRTLARKVRNAQDAYDVAGPRDQPKARLKLQRAEEDYAALCRTPHG